MTKLPCLIAKQNDGTHKCNECGCSATNQFMLGLVCPALASATGVSPQADAPGKEAA